jgi:hypothetical protein
MGTVGGVESFKIRLDDLRSKNIGSSCTPISSSYRTRL